MRCARASGACSPIAGATSDAYRIAADDAGSVLRVRLQVTNSAGTDEALHSRPPTELLLQISENRPYFSLEPAPRGNYVISTAAPIPDVSRAAGGR